MGGPIAYAVKMNAMLTTSEDFRTVHHIVCKIHAGSKSIKHYFMEV